MNKQRVNLTAVLILGIVMNWIHATHINTYAECIVGSLRFCYLCQIEFVIEIYKVEVYSVVF
jgi:hypothetical protein